MMTETVIALQTAAHNQYVLAAVIGLLVMGTLVLYAKRLMSHY